MNRGAGLALIGARGTGKSTVGRLLAERLGRTFLDADVELEAVTGRTIRAIFAEQGEAAFRDVEERMLARLTTGEPNVVIATGGGVVLRESNRKQLRNFGLVVWLTADPTHLAERLERDPQGRDQRPALTAAGTVAELAAVLAAREPLYREAADAIVATEGRTPEEVVALVLDHWEKRSRLR